METKKNKPVKGGKFVFIPEIKRVVYPVPDEQWNLPAGYALGGNGFVSLREVADSTVQTTRSLSVLPTEQRKELIIERLKQQPDFTWHMLGTGTLTRDQAIKEVDAQTTVGKFIQEVEQRVIDDMIERSKRTADESNTDDLTKTQ